MKSINLLLSGISLILLSSCGSVFTDSMNILYNIPLPLFIREKVPQAAAPLFDVEETEFEDPFTVTLKSETPGASIYFTIDGSEPDESTDNLYTEPIPVSETTTIKAIAVKKGYIKSSVADKQYEKCEYDVYISGAISQLIAEDEGATRACYWENGELHLLDTSSSSDDSEANQIVKFNDALYCVGKYNYISHNAGYWINNDFIELTGSDEICEANSIFVYNDDFYIAGTVWDNINKQLRSCYWENGTINYIGDTTYFSNGDRIFIYDNRVFILGQYMDDSFKYHHCYWTDGIRYTFGDEELTPNAKNLFIMNDNIYVVGSQRNTANVTTACYWKNGMRYDIGGGIFYSEAESLIVTNNNDVYIAGLSEDESGKTTACYWENGKQCVLDCGSLSTLRFSAATAITQKGRSIYIAGLYTDGLKITACYWKNGLRQDMYSSDLPFQVTSIIVEKRN